MNEKLIFLLSARRWIFSIFLLIACVAGMGLPSASAYRWVDEQGLVHFGDKPPAEVDATQMQIAPTPSAEQVRQAEEKLRLLMQGQKQREVARLNDAPEISTENKRLVIDCLSTESDLRNAGVNNTSVTITARKLTSQEQSNLLEMLRQMKGRHRGYVNEEVCLGEGFESAVEAKKSKVDMVVERYIGNLFSIFLDTNKNDGLVSNKIVYHFQLFRGYLKFNEGSFMDLDSHQWDVGQVLIEKNKFEFIRIFRRSGQRGGSQQILERIFFSVTRAGVEIREEFYAQGQLSGIKTWQLR